MRAKVTVPLAKPRFIPALLARGLPTHPLPPSQTNSQINDVVYNINAQTNKTTRISAGSGTEMRHARKSKTL